MFNDTKKELIAGAIFISVFFSSGGMVAVEAASAGKNVGEGNRFYQEGNFQQSADRYKEALQDEPESDIVNFNLGTALYKTGQYDEAVEHLQRAFLSEDDALKQKAYYNLGNNFYQEGKQQENLGDFQRAVSLMEKSLGQFERALALDEADADAQHNYGFVQKEIKRLRELMQQQPQQGQNNKPDDSNEQKQSQQQQQNQTKDQQSGGGQPEQQDKKQEAAEQPEDQEQSSGKEHEQQDQQQKSGQQDGQNGEDDYNKQKASTPNQNARELTGQEAQMMLESYQQAEEPQNQLNMHRKTMDMSPVAKDW